MIKAFSIALFFLVAIFFSEVHAEERSYVVEKGETLSAILFNLGGRKIYNKNGLLWKTIALNKSLKKDRGNKIYPGMKLIIPIGKNDSTVEITVAEKNKENEQVKPVEKAEEIAVTKVEKVYEKETDKRKIASSDDQFYFVKALPQVSWIQISSNSSNQYVRSSISASTQANLGLLLNSGISISEKQSVHLFAYFSQINFYPVENYSLSKRSYLRQAYGVGGETLLEQGTRLNYRIGFFDEYYLSMPNITAIQVDMAQIPEVHLGIRTPSYTFKNVTLNNGIFGKIILPYSQGLVKGELGFGAGADTVVKLYNKGMRAFLNYSRAQAKDKSTSSFELGFNLLFEAKWNE